MNFKRTLIAAFVAVTAAIAAPSGSANAAIYNRSIPIPDAVVLLNFSGQGLDWVYAGPIAPNERGPGSMEPASYRASEGWRTATTAEWTMRPNWNNFFTAGYGPGSPINHVTYLFAPEYWSNFTHVDTSDFQIGRVTDGVNGCVACSVPETIYVRNSMSVTPVPEPASLALFGAGLLGLGMVRRRKTASAA